ncbi:MAG: hypothetical protein KBT10_01615 [Bacteroidales bacterium]|nr:hypothetical protein [Candidatus Sodaliphilus aphodohippi]
MNKDKAIEELFRANMPTFNDGDAFLSALNKRLDAVEFVKQYQEKKKRQYKYCMVAALAIGIILGCGTMALAYTMPPMPMHIFHLNIVKIQLWLGHYRLIVVSIMSLLLAVSTIGIFNLLLDINELKMMAHTSKK